MTKKLFALLMAGTIMVPHITPALGNDNTVGVGNAPTTSSSAESWDGLRLPPIPHIETMPWLKYGSAGKGPKVDMLWSPKLDTVGPFLVQPEIPPTKFSLSSSPTESRTWTE